MYNFVVTSSKEQRTQISNDRSCNAICVRIWIYYVLQATSPNSMAGQETIEASRTVRTTQDLDPEPTPQRPHTTWALRSPLPQRSPKSQELGQGAGRNQRRSRVDIARCNDLLGLTLTNPTLCVNNLRFPYRNTDLN